MEPATGQTISQEAPPTLQCERSLLPIDEYAAREGLSRDIIEECGRLGIIQIRKYKGKTFVVDVPLSPYLRPTPASGNDNQTGYEHPHARKVGAGAPPFEVAQELPQAVSKSTQAPKTPKPTQKVAPDAPETTEINEPRPSEGRDEPARPGAISRLVKRMFEMASKIADRPEKTAEAQTRTNKSQNEHIFESAQIPPPKPLGIINWPDRLEKAPSRTTQTENPPEVIQTPELETSNPTETLEIINESIETKETPRPAPVLQNDKAQPLTAHTAPPRFWQAAVFLLSISFLTAVVVGLWLHMDRQIQLDRLQRANAGIQKAHNDLAQTNQRSEALQNELNNYKAELRLAQNELSSSKAEVKKIQDELARTTQGLRAAQQRNSEAVGRLNEQIRRLTTELTEPPQSPPGSIQN